MMTGVDRIHRSDLGNARFDREYYHRNSPVVIIGMAEDWPAAHRWSPRYFAAELADMSVAVNFKENGIFDANRGGTTGQMVRVTMPFTEAARRITSRQGKRYYLQQARLDEFGTLAEDIRDPYLLDESKTLQAVNLWFGGRGCRSPLHYDLGDNFLVQVFGRKRVQLVSPKLTEAVYPAIGDEMPHCSLVDVFDPDLDRFPRYREIADRPVTVEIGPRDALFVPRRWWHAVESTEVAASVNFWWLGDDSSDDRDGPAPSRA
jgi:lysine-specific demethylase 8